MLYHEIKFNFQSCHLLRGQHAILNAQLKIRDATSGARAAQNLLDFLRIRTYKRGGEVDEYFS